MAITITGTPPAPYVVDPNQTNSVLAWAYDPVCVNAGSTVAGAIIYLVKIPTPKTITATNVLVHITTAGTSYSNGQLGLYSSAGTYLSASAVQASGGTNGFGTTGIVTLALGAAQTLTGSPTAFVWAALHIGVNNATAVVAGNIASPTAVNAGLTASVARSAFQTGHTTNALATIGNLTPASNNMAVGTGPFWMGIT